MNPQNSALSTSSIFDNSVLIWALIACGIAQLSKLIFELVINKKWKPLILIETGGMPSSHSALVTSTAAGVGWELGFNHPAFAIASTMAFVVMYDASGIRKEAGNIAARVNEIPSSVWPNSFDRNLKDNLGHSKLEVLIGSIIGPAIALPGIVYLGSPASLIKAIIQLLGWQ